MGVNKPLLRYFGGKFNLAKWVISYLPPHRIYCEPFGGAASVLLAKERAFSEVYNDMDGNVVNLFRVLRDRSSAKELKRQLLYTPFARAEFEAAYEPADDPIERARRLLVRSWMGYSTVGVGKRTGFRTNVKMQQRSAPSNDWKRLIASIEFNVLVSALKRAGVDVGGTEH